MNRTSREHRKDADSITPKSSPAKPPVVKSLALERRLAEVRCSPAYLVEYAKETFSDELWQAMEARKLSQVEFAQKAGVSKQFLTKVFAGSNCTIETMVRLAHALDFTVNLHLTPKEIESRLLFHSPNH